MRANTNRPPAGWADPLCTSHIPASRRACPSCRPQLPSARPVPQRPQRLQPRAFPPALEGPPADLSPSRGSLWAVGAVTSPTQSRRWPYYVPPSAVSIATSNTANTSRATHEPTDCLPCDMYLVPLHCTGHSRTGYLASDGSAVNPHRGWSPRLSSTVPHFGDAALNRPSLHLTDNPSYLAPPKALHTLRSFRQSPMLYPQVRRSRVDANSYSRQYRRG